MKSQVNVMVRRETADLDIKHSIARVFFSLQGILVITLFSITMLELHELCIRACDLRSESALLFLVTRIFLSLLFKQTRFLLRKF